MRVLLHVALSTAVAVILNATYGLVPAFFAFPAGIVIDGDHFIDWLLWSEERSLRSLLVLGTWFVKPHVTYLFLHSYELLAPLWLFVWLTNTITIGMGITAGFVTHLIADQLFNYMRYGSDALNCFMTYRILRFEKRLKLYEKHMATYRYVLERDGIRCRMCGAANPGLEVHMDKYAYGEEAPDQYITVCPSCHTKKHVFFWKLLSREKHRSHPFIKGDPNRRAP